MLKTPISRLRVVGLLEAVSFLLLVGVAMPLKYLAGMPEMVQVVGWVHGALFMLFVAAVAQAAAAYQWSLRWVTEAVVAAVVPFGPFVLDRRLRGLEESVRRAGAPEAEPA